MIVHEHGHAELKAQYALVPRYAEMPTFVNKCIKDGKYEHGPQVTMRAMGGRPPGTCVILVRNQASSRVAHVDVQIPPGVHPGR